MLLQQTLEEIERGPLSPAQAAARTDTPQWQFAMELYIDAMSIIAALSVKPIKPPAQKNLVNLLLWLAELVRTKRITMLAWVDTLEMAADGLTKGSVAREALEQAMAGIMVNITTAKQLRLQE